MNCFECRYRHVVFGQKTGGSFEFPKIQSENCLHGRESLRSKELKRVKLNIPEKSAFGCPTQDLHGFSLEQREVGFDKPVRITGCGNDRHLTVY